MPWPPQLQDLKDDLGLSGDRDDVALAAALDAAVSYVEDARDGDFDFAADPLSVLPDPSPQIELGTVRLAGRWFNRRQSPNGLVDMGELGSARIPSTDLDVERLLGIGRFARPLVG